MISGLFKFPTATVGYAVGEARVTARTQNGGDTWNVLVGPEEPNDQCVYDVFFLDANTGYEVRAGGKLKRTTDGGQTWQGVIAQLDVPEHQIRRPGSRLVVPEQNLGVHN